MNNVKCIGCGSTLQSENKNLPGYIPKSGMANEDAICKRCYRLKHYNEVMDVDVNSSDFLTMLNALYEVDGIILKLIDVFDFEGSIVPSFNRIVGDKPVIAVINKIDLLPKSVNQNRLVHRAKQILKNHGIKSQDAVVISAVKNQNIDTLLNKLQNYGDQNIYVVGTTNVGKSTLINRLIENTTGEKEVITTSRFPGTTLDLIDIPIGNNRYIFDTPGIVSKSQIAHYVNASELKYVSPVKEIKPKSFQLQNGQTLFISNLARIDFTNGDQGTFTVYASRDLNIHRTKLQNADEFYAKHYDGLLSPPVSGEVLNSGDVHRFKTTERSDIVISGLSFISIPKDINVTVTVPEGVQVSLRTTIFKGE